MKQFVCLITGPAGVGKSTIVKKLSKMFQKTAVVDVDYIRHMITNGMTDPKGKTEESIKQLGLGKKNAAQLTNNFANAGFSVFIDDVVTSRRSMDYYLKGIKFPFVTFYLTCERNILKKRDSKRDKKKIMGERSIELHKLFSNSDEDRWIKIDTTEKSVVESVKEIFEKLKLLGKTK